MKTASIMTIKFNPLTMENIINKIDSQLQRPKPGCRLVVTPNAEIVMKALQDKELKQIINEAWLSTPDGAGVILASKLLPDLDPFPARIAGFDLLQQLLQLAAKKDYSVFFLGGEPGVAEQAADRLKKVYPSLVIAGFHHGFFNQGEQNDIINQITAASPDLLFVGMGAPRQEKFLARQKNDLAAKVALTVGGSFDILAEKKKRAPLIWQKLYLEWLYRLLQEPSRLSRMAVLPRYLLKISREAWRQKFQSWTQG